MKYPLIVSDMTWSYSRIKTFANCKYMFLLKYIYNEPEKRMFFSEYGSFLHSILEQYYKGTMSKDEMVNYYLTNFISSVRSKAPTPQIFTSYFNSGLQYLKNFQPIEGDVVGVEKEINFKVGDYSFIGYIDLLVDCNGSLSIIDNKSRALKKRSKRKKPTLSDLELDDYLKQLYTYAYGYHQESGDYPETLSFNCFRTNEIITEAFEYPKIEETNEWLLDEIGKIEIEDDWEPTIDRFFCKNICGVSDRCDYCQILLRGGSV